MEKHDDEQRVRTKFVGEKGTFKSRPEYKKDDGKVHEPFYLS